MSNKLLLIDGHSILNRAFYGIPDLTNSEGLHTNAVYGFLNIMFKVLDEEKPTHFAVAFDVKEKTFRHKMFEGYKGTRKPMPNELHEQVPLIKEVLHAMNILTVEKPGYEADDILGTLAFEAEKAGADVSIISGDRDLLQLATKKIKIRIPKTKKGVTEIENYNWDDVIEKYQVDPVQFIDLKALMGDTSDNIPGVAGIGEKTASKIISQYGSIENAYEHIEEIMPNKARENMIRDEENARLSKVLATIDVNAPLEISYEAGQLGDLFSEKAYEIISRLEFKSILTKFNAKTVEAACVDVKSLIKKLTCESQLDEVLDIIQKSEQFGFSFETFVKEKENGGQITFDFLNEGLSNNDDEQVYIFALSVDNSIYIIDSEKVEGKTSKDIFDKINQKITALNSSRISLFGLKKCLKNVSFSKKSDILDIEIGAYLLNPLKDTYTYSDIARDYMNTSISGYEELLKKNSIRALYEKNYDELIEIVCCNAYVADKSSDKILKTLETENMKELYYGIELPLIFSLNDMENAGVILNSSALKEYGNNLSESINLLEKKIYDECGIEFNINSPKQLGEILFEKMEIPGGKKTKTGYSTSADVLEKLKPDYPFVSDILEYRQLTKLKSTYADGLLNYISEDGRIHGKFNQTITATGRISSTEPNLQNIPIRMPLGSLIRKVFVPKEGFVFVDADYSQIELRILAHMSKDMSLIEAYNSGKDIHTITASKVFNTPLQEVTKTQRSNAKAVNFGIVYGISSFGLSQDLSISRKEANQYIEQYFETYPGVKEYLDSQVAFAKENGYVVTMFNRKRPIPEIKSSNFMQRSFGERIAMNSPIQGTAADIMKIAMINVDNKLKERKLESRIVLQVHDELLVETKKDEVDIVKEILVAEMSSAAKLLVKLEIGIAEGSNWLEAH